MSFLFFFDKDTQESASHLLYLKKNKRLRKTGGASPIGLLFQTKRVLQQAYEIKKVTKKLKRIIHKLLAID